MRHFLRALICLALPSAATADYFDDTGYTALKNELGEALPIGAGVRVTQVETTVSATRKSYAAEAGEGTFSAVTPPFAGKMFRALSGASGVSGHAAAVGGHFYGPNRFPTAIRAGFTPGIPEVDFYWVGSPDSADSWLGSAWLRPSRFTPPLTETRAVQNHSWISNHDAGEEVTENELLRRLDFAIERDGFLCVAGVNNRFAGQEAPEVPALLCSAYNNLSVGVSTGMHSAGGVLAPMEGPGRQKPEIVAPLDYTSYATALVSSAAALLRERANILGSDAARPQTLKAVLLAGAEKDKFGDWTRTSTLPMDPRYGAGELNIHHSWHILNGGAQPVVPANTSTKTTTSDVEEPAAAADEAWGVSSGPAEWRLIIPEGQTGTVLSVAAVWHRVVRNTGEAARFTPEADALSDYNLTLERLTTDGVSVIDESRSGIENVEILHDRTLPSGTYRIRLSLDSGAAVPCAVAWRLSTAPHTAGISLTVTGKSAAFHFDGLIPGQRYEVQWSGNLTNWTGLTTFTAEGAEFQWTTTPGQETRYYRLAALNP